jgi:hypothetical protein
MANQIGWAYMQRDRDRLRESSFTSLAKQFGEHIHWSVRVIYPSRGFNALRCRTKD